MVYDASASLPASASVSPSVSIAACVSKGEAGLARGPPRSPAPPGPRPCRRGAGRRARPGSAPDRRCAGARACSAGSTARDVAEANVVAQDEDDRRAERRHARPGVRATSRRSSAGCSPPRAWLSKKPAAARAWRLSWRPCRSCASLSRRARGRAGARGGAGGGHALPARVRAGRSRRDRPVRPGAPAHGRAQVRGGLPKLGREASASRRAAARCLNLAECYEHTGQTASAWVAWKDAAARANAAGKADVEKRAQSKAAALEPNLARLTVAVDADSDVPGLEVKNDGVAVGHAEFGVRPAGRPRQPPRCRHMAPSKKPFSAKADVAAKQTDARILVHLESEPEAVAPPPPPPGGDRPPPPLPPPPPPGGETSGASGSGAADDRHRRRRRGARRASASARRSA